MRRTNGVRYDGSLWIWRIEGLADGIAVRCIVRTDKMCFGGHHPIVVLSQMAMETIAFVIAHQCAKNPGFDPALLNDLSLDNLRKLLENQRPLQVAFDGWMWSARRIEGSQFSYAVADSLVFRVDSEERKAAIQWLPLISTALEAKRRVPSQSDVKTVRAGTSRLPAPLFVIDIPEIDYDSFMN